jgi:hypothetical protein
MGRGSDANDVTFGSAIQERIMTITTAKLSQWSGAAALVAGVSYMLVGLFHPLNELASASTPTWAVVHVLACTTAFLGLFGVTGIYVRQVEAAGWTGLAGFVMLSLWFALVLSFSFIEAFVMPVMVATAPRIVEGWMAMFTVPIEGIELGVMPTLWLVSGPLYILGGLLFGIATFRAGVLPRWSGALLAVGTAAAPVAALFPFEYQSKVTLPVGLALAWMGYALWSQRRGVAMAVPA